MDADGKAYSHLESNRYDSLIEDYRAFAYNNLFGAQQRCGSFFSRRSKSCCKQNPSDDFFVVVQKVVQGGFLFFCYFKVTPV